MSMNNPNILVTQNLKYLPDWLEYHQEGLATPQEVGAFVCGALSSQEAIWLR